MSFGDVTGCATYEVEKAQQMDDLACLGCLRVLQGVEVASKCICCFSVVMGGRQQHFSCDKWIDGCFWSARQP